MISSILPTSPKELSSCSSERSVFLALLDYRRPRRLPFTCLPPPACRAAYASLPSKAVPLRAAPGYSTGTVLLPGAALGGTALQWCWLALFSPKAAKTRPARPGRPNQQPVARPAGAKVFHCACAAWLRNPAPRRPQLGPK